MRGPDTQNIMITSDWDLGHTGTSRGFPMVVMFQLNYMVQRKLMLISMGSFILLFSRVPCHKKWFETRMKQPLQCIVSWVFL
jgi:hypothetical protein